MDVILQWDDPNNDPTEVEGYILYYWQTSWEAPIQVDVGKRTTYTLEDLETGPTYYMAITARDDTGKRESEFSNIVDTNGVLFAVNAGGPEYIGTNGTLYQADTQFSGGRTSATSAAIEGTEDDVLYQSERYGDFAYAIPLADGDYEVTLRFAEIYWGAADQRIFDVHVEGTEVLSNLDLVAQVGQLTAYDAVIPVTVTDGVLDLSFHTDSNNAKVSAIMVAASRGDQPSTPGVNIAPVAHDSNLTTPANTMASGTLQATDADGDALSYRLVNQSTQGTVTIVDTTTGAYTYTPKPGVSGTDTFTFQVNDGTTDSNVAAVAVTITPAPPENTDPEVVDDPTTDPDDSDDPTTTTPEPDAVVFAVNAGGAEYVDAAGILYEADSQFEGGRTRTTTAAITATDDAPLYQSERYGDFAYNIPLPNGNYVVTLRFAETYWSEAGKRVFDIAIEGQEVQSDLDLVAEVGQHVAYDVSVPVTVIDEVLDLRFHTDLNNATVSAILVAVDEEAPAPPADDVVFAVNAGGAEYVDAAGILYEADSQFEGGRTRTTTAAITATDDAPLYQSERYGDFAYNIPLPNGNYVVTLRFAETYWSEAGKRVFDVKIEEAEIVSDLDLVAEAGPGVAYDLAVPSTVTDGVLNIHFRTDRNNAQVSAIVVEVHTETP